jgi:hypothetical protein
MSVIEGPSFEDKKNFSLKRKIGDIEQPSTFEKELQRLSELKHIRNLIFLTMI